MRRSSLLLRLTKLEGRGRKSVPDTTAPTITSASSGSVNENVVLSFSLTANETVTWSIVGGADQAQYEISGSTLRWASNGTKDFEAPNDADTNNTYVVTVRATDTSSNTTDQTITITVLNVVDETAPTVSAFTPLDNATGVSISNNLTVQFSETVQFHTAVSITIKKTSDNSTVQAFTEADIGVGISIATDTLTINPSSDLTNSIEYYILIGATSIKDATGNFYAGIAATTTWSFTTVAVASGTTVFTATVATSDAAGSWDGFTIAQSIVGATISAASGTQVRLTLEFDALGNAETAVVYFGLKNGFPSFTGTQVHMLFGGGNIVGNGSTQHYVSDWVTLGEAYDETADYMAAIQFTGGQSATILKGASVGNQYAYKAGADAATTAKAGYTTFLTDTVALISKIEIQ